MKFEEISDGYKYSYEKKCPCCDCEQELLTQRDGFPEYYTSVYLKCQCGEYIHFELPVN